jgi:hypothetical protein
MATMCVIFSFGNKCSCKMACIGFKAKFARGMLLMTGLLMVNCAFGQVKLGAFVGRYPNRNLGLGVGAEIDLHKKLSISPSLAVYFPRAYGAGGTFMANLNANYKFFSTQKVGFYTVSGVVVLRNRTIFYDGGNSPGNLNQTLGGINLGIGANINLTTFTPFAETNYRLISGWPGANFLIGVKAKLSR